MEVFPGHGRQTARNPAVDGAGGHWLVSQAEQCGGRFSVTLYDTHHFNHPTAAAPGPAGQQSQLLSPGSVVTTQSASELHVASPMLRDGSAVGALEGCADCTGVTTGDAAFRARGADSAAGAQCAAASGHRTKKPSERTRWATIGARVARGRVR